MLPLGELDRQYRLHLLGNLRLYRGADKSLARPGRKTSYSDQTLTFARHSKKFQKVVRPTRSPLQHWPPRRTKKWRPFNCFFSRVGPRAYQHPLYRLQLRVSAPRWPPLTLRSLHLCFQANLPHVPLSILYRVYDVCISCALQCLLLHYRL